MTTIPNPDEHTPLDQHARQLHAASLASVSPRTLVQLRGARRAAAETILRRRPAFAPWLAGGALAASVALAVMLLPGGHAPPTGPVSTPAATVAVVPAIPTTATSPVEPLQEDPGFYLWLESTDATALAME